MSEKLLKDERTAIEEELNKFYRIHNIKIEGPVDVFKIATDLGFDVRATLFRDSVEGIIVVNENADRLNGFRSNKVIAYNQASSMTSKVFIVAHELGHYIDEKSKNPDKKIIVAARDHVNNHDKDEQRIDYLAAAILIPSEDMKKRFPRPEAITEEYVKAIANTYIVSENVARRRIFEVYE